MAPLLLIVSLVWHFSHRLVRECSRDIIDLWSACFVEIIHRIDPAARLLLDRSAGPMLLLLLLGAAQPLGWGGRSEVRRAITSARTAETARAARTGSAEAATEATRARTAEAAATRPRTAKATSAWGTGSGSAETARSSRRTVFPGARFAHGKIAAHEGLRVETLDDLLADRPIRELDKREPTRASGLAIHWHHDVRWFSDGSKVTAEVGLCGAVGEVPDEQTN